MIFRFLWVAGTFLALVCAPSLELRATDGGCLCSPEQTSKAFSTVAKKAMPAVLFIKVQSAASDQDEYSSTNPGYQNPFDFNDDFFNRFFGGSPRQPPKQAVPQVSQGSGFLVSADGYIMTNSHV